MSFTIGTAMSMASLAVGAAGMAGSASTAGAQARGAIATTKGQLELSRANTQIDNANSSLANFMTAFNNNRQLTQYGKAAAALNSNIANAKDSAVANKLEASLQKAEARGALAANMGFAGSSGASFEAIEGSMRLKQARQEQNAKDNLKQLNYNAAQEQLGLIDNGLMGLDMSVNGGSVNTSRVAPAVTGGTNYLSAIANSDMLGYVGKIAGAWPGSGVSGTSNLTGGGLGLKVGGGLGMTMPSASTSFFSLGDLSSSKYSLSRG